MKQKERCRGGGSVEKGVGSEQASLKRPSRGPPCSPNLCHPVAETQLAPMEGLASLGPLEGRWCYVCRAGLRVSCNKYCEVYQEFFDFQFPSVTVEPQGGGEIYESI